MASIQSLGVGSGLLTSDLVDKIVASERQATDLRIDSKKTEFEARISAFGSVKSSLSKLQTAASALSSSRQLLSPIASSSDADSVTAATSSLAKPGVHSVEVTSLARAHTLASMRFDELDSVVGDGTLTFSFGNTTLDTNGNYDTFTENPDRTGATVTIDPANNTLTGVRDAVNDADIGVTASIVNDGQGYLLVFASTDSGADNSMEITVSEGETAGLSALAFNASASTPGTNMTQTVAAADAVVVVDGIQVSRETNQISDVVAGVTFTAVATNTGSPATITVAQDTQGISEKMQTFVDAYNEVKDLADQLTAFDQDSGTGALLMGDATLRGIRSQLRHFLSNGVNGVESSSLKSLVDIGISTDQNDGYRLHLDSQKLAGALETDPTGVAALLGDQSRASDDLIRFASFQTGTQPGDYDVNVTRVATRGYLQGTSVAGLAGPVIIDDNNDSITVRVDGASSGPISLTQGTYADGTGLAAALETAINADSSLKATNHRVAVEYDSVNQRLTLTSTAYGSTSQVGITAVDVDTAATLGLDVDTGESTRGVDVAGSINGIEATGAGQYLSVPQGALPATSGYYRGNDVASFDTPPLTLDASNSSFTLAVDGVTSETVQLTLGDYASGTDLAAEMETQINADTNLIAEGKEVTVTYDGVNGRFEVRSASTGVQSTVRFVDVPAGAQSAFGFTPGSGTAGRAVSEVNDAAGGIQIQVLGGDTGPRGQVTLVRGAMNQFDRYLRSVVDFGGSLDSTLSTLQDRVDDLDQQAADFDKRMTSLEDRLRKQFAASDALISELNSTSEFLTQQLSALPGFSSSSSSKKN